MALLEVKTTPDGRVLAKRKDGRALTPEDREEARRTAVRMQVQQCTDYLSIKDVCCLLSEAFCEINRIYLPGTVDWLKAEKPQLWQESLSLEQTLSNQGKALAQARGNRAQFDQALSRYKQVWQEAIALRRGQRDDGHLI